MNCKSCQEKILDYVIGNLRDEEREQLEEHIQSCEACQKDIKELKDIIYKIKNNRNNLPFPGTFMDKVQQKVHLSRKQKNKAKKSKKGILFFSISIICIGIIILSLLYTNLGQWLEELIR